jgi:uncharacterized RDD family membrane protein YckC
MARQYFHAHETARYDELEGLPLADFWQRALGFVIDFLVVILLWAPLELLWARYVSGEWDGVSKFHISFSYHEWRSLLVAMLYYVVANFVTNGMSLGKWIARTRVMSLVSGRLGLWQCVERVLGYGVSAGEVVGFVQFFWSANRMCVHDRIAETIVVDIRKTALRLAGIDDGDSDELVELVEGL